MLLKIIQFILQLFGWKPTPLEPPIQPAPQPAPTPVPVPRPPTPAPLVLLHPQEPQNPAQTMTTPNLIANALNTWFTDWNVLVENQAYFAGKIVISMVQPLIVNGNESPACSYDDGTARHLDIEPSWCNAGVIAHEQAHNSYALLTDAQKATFTALWDGMKNTDPKLVYLWTVNSYGTTSDVEGHAECYRYWGSEMPEDLKAYYPKLF